MMETSRENKGTGLKKTPLLWVVLILLVAAVIRLYGLNNFSPPGLEHDEVANWLIDRAILDGQHGIYFSEAYGHEAGFHYLQAASVALLGDHALALRLPAAFLGLLVVAVQYALARRLFGVPVALISMAILAVLFWPVFYSRLGLRAIMLPFISGIALYCFWQGWLAKRGAVSRPATAAVKQSKLRPPDGSGILQTSTIWFGVAGILAGLSMYTYMAARSVPIFFAIFLVYLAIFHWPRLRQKWRGLLLFGLLFTAVALPLLLFLAGNPGSEFRISEIDGPLRALVAGDFTPALQNSLKILGMFGFSGDPLWRQNVAGRPVFGPLLAILFYGGLLLALWRWRRTRYAFLLIWLGAAAIPSIVTVDAPSSIRMINALLVITIIPALVIHIIPSLSTVKPKLSTTLAVLIGFVLAAVSLLGSTQALFKTWPENEEVQFVWQAALTETAAILDSSSAVAPVSIGGWSPATMDPPTMQLSMRRDDLDMRFFGSDSTVAPVTTVIIPAGETDQTVRIFRPAIRDLASGLEEQLLAWGGEPQYFNHVVQYQLDQPIPIQPDTPMDENFADQLHFLGYAKSGDWDDCQAAGCRLLSYWQVLEPVPDQRRFFLHALDESGEIIGQHDGLDAPAQYWHSGDILLQEHALTTETAVPTALRLGVYDPQTGVRLQLLDGQDQILLTMP